MPTNAPIAPTAMIAFVTVSARRPCATPHRDRHDQVEEQLLVFAQAGEQIRRERRAEERPGGEHGERQEKCRHGAAGGRRGCATMSQRMAAMSNSVSPPTIVSWMRLRDAASATKRRPLERGPRPAGS